jgi:tetratricopeptide (TPR) repeat protein
MVKELKDLVQFWQELKQRKVVRVMTVYIASAFAVLQAADMILPRVGLPEWTVTLVLVLLGAGLIIAIVFTWIYDITPEGIKKTSDLKQTLKNGKKRIEIELPLWESTVTQIGEEPVSYRNDLYAERIKQYKRKGKIYNYSSVFVILAVSGLFIFSSSNSVPFNKRDWVLITDFENLTEDPVFDRSLYTAFSLTLNQSRHINVFSRPRMIETLTRMKVKDPGFTDERTGRELALREGINVYIVPSIAQIGKNYVITAKIQETKTGNIFKSIVLNVENQNNILTKLDKLSKIIRRDLGEPRYRISIQDKPLSKVTTSSLEALKQYSLGIQSHYRMDFTAAKNYYSNAIQIDTGFTAAKASLGNILIERFDPEKGRELLNQAVKHVDNLTDKEKYGILAFHAINVENNNIKGIEYAKILTELYPDDPAYRNNLGWYYQKSGRFEEALKEYKTAVTINPNQVITFGGILWIYLEKLGKPDTALVWAEKMISANAQNAWGYYYSGSAWLCLNNIEKAVNAYHQALEMDPYFLTNQYNLAQAYNIQGRYEEAIRILERIIENNNDESSTYSERILERNQNEPSAAYQIGINYEALGNQEEARKYFTIFKKTVTEEWMKKRPNDAVTYIAIGNVTAHLGDIEYSKEMLQKAIGIDSTLHERFAEVLCAQGNMPEALYEIEKSLNNGFRNLLWFKLNPDLQVLYKNVRFRNLLEKYFR